MFLIVYAKRRRRPVFGYHKKHSLLIVVHLIFFIEEIRVNFGHPSHLMEHFPCRPVSVSMHSMPSIMEHEQL